jgi:hypothetical protein
MCQVGRQYFVSIVDMHDCDLVFLAAECGGDIERTSAAFGAVDSNSDMTAREARAPESRACRRAGRFPETRDMVYC